MSTGRTHEEHDLNLGTVLMRLQDAGLRLRKAKCAFREKSCTYHGHVIDAEGIHPTKNIVRAVLNSPAPQNVQEPRSYLELIHYYHNVLCNLSILLAPLHEMTRQHTYLYVAYGRDFVLQTDHLPLIGLLGEGRAISAMANARIQIWALTLSNYKYHLEYRPGTSICHADGLSILPLPDTPGRVPVLEEVVLAFTTMNDTFITAEHFR